jgi:hypothetical protein
MKLFAIVVGMSIAFCPVLASAEESPAKNYAHDSVGMSLATGIADIWGNGTSGSTTLSGFQLNIFRVTHQVFLGAGFQGSYSPALHINDAILTNTLSLGVVTPVTEAAAVTFKVNGGLLYSPSGNSSLMESCTGTVALEEFFGKYAYMELYTSGGGIWNNSPAQVFGTFGAGYSIGLVF